ncbi:MAG: penicillin-binding protein activator LpoB [Kiritimatiellae bacterium]|nr:penicillin-binding protein activator LpoB [Kiritimatiellia bacterium]
MKHILLPALAAVLLAGCATTPERVDRHNDKGPEVMGLDYRDFNEAAAEALRSIREEGTVYKPEGGRYVVYVGRVINKTTQNWETTQLTKAVTIELRKSGKVVVTMVPPDDDSIEGVKPELVLTGKVSERNIQMTSSKKQTEYYLELELTDPKTKLVFWEGQAPIVKRGSSKTVNW